MRFAPTVFVLAALAAPVTTEGPASATEPPEDHPTSAGRWCAPELRVLPGEVCYHVPDKPTSGPRTLVIYLHGVIQPETTSQWNQQRAAARIGATYGFSVIVPRGRRGIGPKNMEQWWTWPTSWDARRAYEDVLVAEWQAAREALEKEAGKPFERVYVFGFSNGAYYATSLAMRARLEVNGYALFAGGSGAPYHEAEGKGTKKRAPIVVAWGAGDPSHDRQKALAKMLRRMKWPFLEVGRRRAGHAMTDDQVEKALDFLGHR